MRELEDLRTRVDQPVRDAFASDGFPGFDMAGPWVLDLPGMGEVAAPATRPTAARSERRPACRGTARAVRR